MTNETPIYADPDADLNDRIASAERAGAWDWAMTLKHQKAAQVAQETEVTNPSPEDSPPAFKPERFESTEDLQAKIREQSNRYGIVPPPEDAGGWTHHDPEGEPREVAVDDLGGWGNYSTARPPSADEQEAQAIPTDHAGLLDAIERAETAETTVTRST